MEKETKNGVEIHPFVSGDAPLYHHAFFGTEDGDWAIVQQGIDTERKIARRYHWTSEGIEDFIEEPHDSILAEKKKDKVLNMTASTSEECRKTSIDLVKDNPEKIQRDFQSLLIKSVESFHVSSAILAYLHSQGV